MIQKHRPARGQSLTEYALILGLIAVCCFAAVAFARDATAAAFEAHAAALDEPDLPTPDYSLIPPDDPTATPTPVPTATPTATPTVTPTPDDPIFIVPETRADCKNGGWRDFITPDGTFASRAECYAYVDSH